MKDSTLAPSFSFFYYFVTPDNLIVQPSRLLVGLPGSHQSLKNMLTFPRRSRNDRTPPETHTSPEHNTTQNSKNIEDWNKKVVRSFHYLIHHDTLGAEIVEAHGKLAIGAEQCKE